MTTNTRRSNMFNIQESYMQVMDELENTGGVITPELDELLKITEQELESKMKAYHHFIQIINSDINVIDGEIERLTRIKGSKEATIESLRTRMLDALLLMGNDGEPNKKTGKRNKVLRYDTLSMWTTNRESVIVTHPLDIDEEYKRYSISTSFSKKQMDKINAVLVEDGKIVEATVVVSKKELKEAIDAGKIIKGVYVETKPSITLK